MNISCQSPLKEDSHIFISCQPPLKEDSHIFTSCQSPLKENSYIFTSCQSPLKVTRHLQLPCILSLLLVRRKHFKVIIMHSSRLCHILHMHEAFLIPYTVCYFLAMECKHCRLAGTELDRHLMWQVCPRRSDIDRY